MSSLHDVKIIQSDTNKARIFIDEMEIKGAISVDYSAKVNEPAEVTLRFYAGTLNTGKESKEKTATAQVNVTVKDTDVFKDIIGLLGRIMIDGRIQEEVRDEIYKKLKEINDKCERECNR